MRQRLTFHQRRAVRARREFWTVAAYVAGACVAIPAGMALAAIIGDTMARDMRARAAASVDRVDMVCEARATDFSGNEFVAGRGDTPRAALRLAVWPAEIAEFRMICNPV